MHSTKQTLKYECVSVTVHVLQLLPPAGLDLWHSFHNISENMEHVCTRVNLFICVSQTFVSFVSAQYTSSHLRHRVTVCPAVKCFKNSETTAPYSHNTNTSCKRTWNRLFEMNIWSKQTTMQPVSVLGTHFIYSLSPLFFSACPSLTSFIEVSAVCRVLSDCWNQMNTWWGQTLSPLLVLSPNVFCCPHWFIYAFVFV